MSLEQLKIAKCMEWCTNLPTEKQSRKSSVFFLDYNEWFFEFVIDNDGDYCIYSRSKHLKLKEQKLQVKFEVMKVEGTSILFKGVFNLKETEYLWFTDVDDLKKSLNTCSLSEACLKFRFFFNNETGLYLSIKDKTNDKSVQTHTTYNEDSCLMESLSRDMCRLFDEGPSHDVEFKCKDQTIKAHKNVLCCHSAVFASMLQSDMEEGKTGRVNIQDVDAIIFEQFLRCVYTGKLPKLTVENAFQLYEVADKYCTLAIKKQCACFLTDNLSIENACDILILADRHNDEVFKKDIIEYFVKEEMPYMGQKWTDFCKENPVLANEVYFLLCQQFRQNKI